MKKVYILLALVILLGATAVSASGGLPDSVFEWTREDGSICSAIISEYGVALDCDCPCGDAACAVIECEDCEQCQECGECEICTECKECKEEVEKEKCNAGRGNGSEGDPDCDPGNSIKNKGGD